MTPLLEIAGVTKSFGGLAALDGLDLHVDEGEIVSAIGPNGAGKSTLFNVITGLYSPDAGDIKLRGDSIVGRAIRTAPAPHLTSPSEQASHS